MWVSTWFVPGSGLEKGNDKRGRSTYSTWDVQHRRNLEDERGGRLSRTLVVDYLITVGLIIPFISPPQGSKSSGQVR